MRFPESSIIRNYAAAGLCAVLASSSGVVAYRANAALKTADRTLAQTDRAANALADFAVFQTQQLQSERNQKAIEASLATAAIFNGTGRLINTKTIPEINKTIANINQSVELLNTFIARTDQNINADLLPAATVALNESAAAIKAFGLTAEKTSIAIEQLANEGKITAQEARAFLNSEEFKSIWSNLNKVSLESAATSANITATTAQIAEASKQLPSVAADIKAFTATTSKFRKAILVAMILGALSPALAIIR